MQMARRATRLRVAVVTETYPPEVNGVARTIALMVDALLARGHAVQLVRPRQREELPDARPGFSQWLTRGMPIPRYGSLQLGLVPVSRIEANWRQWRPDVVQVATEGPLGWTAVRAATRLGIPIATDFHTNFHAYSRDYGIGRLGGAIARYLKHFHNRTDCTMVPTREMRAALARLGFERLCVAGRGIDSSLFHPARRSEALRRTWGCGPGDLVALQVGRLAPEKNLPLFLRAVESMRACNAALKVVIVEIGRAHV